jgi:hypothetical protein
MDEQPPQDQGQTPASEPLSPQSITEPKTTPSWEHTDELGFFGALIRTIAEVLFHPETTFRNLKTGSIGAPFLFGWLLQSLFTLISAYQAKQMIFGALRPYMPHLPDLYSMHDIFPMIFVIVPIAAAIGLFIQTGVIHVCLMITGAAKRDIEITFRVVAYTMGATAVWNIIPWIGSFIALVWQSVCLIIGLKEAHQTTAGRVILAMVLPFLICCGIAIMVMGTMIGKIL